MKRLIQWITWTPARLLLTIIMVLALLGGGIATAITLTRHPAPGTTNPAAPTGAATTPSHSEFASPSTPAVSTPPPSPAVSPPAAAPSPTFTPLEPVPKEVLEPVQTYLTASNNQWSAHREQPADWLTDARPALTAPYYDKLAAEFKAVEGGSLGADWDEYHDNSWKVRISDIHCFAHPVGKPADSPDNPIQCSYRRTITDLNDQTLPGARPSQPTTWTLEDNALLTVVHDNGWWYISDDVTGKAG